MEVSVKCEARHICIRLSGELDHHSAKGLLRRLDQEIEKALPTQQIGRASCRERV